MVKINVTYIIISFYFLLSGVEYAVILPTLNAYLLSLGAGASFIGFVMSSFSLTGLLSAPIYGRITDKTQSTKMAVGISNLFEITGNVMYFAARNPYMVLGSRLVAGLGSGSGSSIFGMISRSTTKEERTATFSRLMSLRQIGLVIGPAFNLFLEKMDFYIGPIHVTALTVPGLFMATLWLIHTIMLVIFYRELYEKPTVTDVDDDCFEKESEDTPIPPPRPRDRAPSRFFNYVYKDLLREEVVVCLSVTFTLMFVQTGNETLVTPLSRQFFDWDELPNSIFYSIAGVILIISFLGLALVSKKASDRNMLVAGLIVMVVLYVIYVVFIVFAVQQPVGTPWVLAVFCIHSAILVADLPFVWVPQASLFSKVTSERTQSFNQGIRLLVMGLGQILGPLWAASFLDRLPIMASVNLALVVLVLIMVLLSYKRLESPTDEPVVPPSNDQASDHAYTSERTPLLNGKNSSAAINA